MTHHPYQRQSGPLARGTRRGPAEREEKSGRAPRFRLLAAVLGSALFSGGWTAAFGQAAGRGRGGYSAKDRQRARNNPDAFEIAAVSIEKLGPNLHLKAPPGELEAPPPVDGSIDLDRIINAALKAWEIIKENAPVVNVSRSYANAVPAGISRWDQLSGWKPPQGTVYAFKAVNKFGATVVNLKYQVIRTFGGGLEDSEGTVRGKYLTGVTIEPLMIETAWGYRLDMSVAVPSVINAGASKEAPVAGMTVNLQWNISTPLKDMQGTGVYYLQGDGLFVEVGGPFKAEFAERMAPRLESIRMLATPGWEKLLEHGR